MNLTFEQICAELSKFMPKPYDDTKRHWFLEFDTLYQSGEGDPEDPDEWSGGGYSFDNARVLGQFEGYILMSYDGHCGGTEMSVLDYGRCIRD